MRKIGLSLATLALFAAATLVGCSGTSAKSPDVSDGIRKSLDQAGLKDVSVSQDRVKGVVTLDGQVANQHDKMEAKALAEFQAGAQVVADQILIIPPGLEREAKAVNSDLNEGIEKNLDAALIHSKLHRSVQFEVNGGVVTLTGEVNSEIQRDRAEHIAMKVPNVQQVVNNLQIKDQKATSSR
jgi:hyperosmotically inducible periplasmic protein